MKHLKHFSERKDKPEIGDYVIIKTASGTEKVDFINNNIGYIDRMFHSYYVILYDIDKDKDKDKEQEPGQWNDIYNKEDLKKLSFYAQHYEIKYWSKDKEELEILLQANKFNI